MIYKANPKHKEPWQPGRKGSLCPSWSHAMAAELLSGSVPAGNKRYATRQGRAFAGQHDGSGVWHGYPVSWHEVPEPIRRRWVESRLVRRQDLAREWREITEETRD